MLDLTLNKKLNKKVFQNETLIINVIYTFWTKLVITQRKFQHIWFLDFLSVHFISFIWMDESVQQVEDKTCW